MLRASTYIAGAVELADGTDRQLYVGQQAGFTAPVGFVAGAG